MDLGRRNAAVDLHIFQKRVPVLSLSMLYQKNVMFGMLTCLGKRRSMLYDSSRFSSQQTRIADSFFFSFWFFFLI